MHEEVTSGGEVCQGCARYIYEDSIITVRCAVGMAEGILSKVEVGLHQGLALSPFSFVMVMDRLIDEVRQESP